MRRLAAFALIAVATPALAADRTAQCRLTVAGTRVIDGPCTFSPIGRDGSFQVMSRDDRWFAQVSITTPGRAEGWWNEEAGAGHAHTALGPLSRDGACWRGAAAEVCAW